MKEADIEISGTKLNTGQSMAVRVALQNFALFLAENGLGDDAHGKLMTAGYLKAITEINVLIMKTAK
jgi:hypothetical protein